MSKRKTNDKFIKEVYGLVRDEYVFLDEYIKDNVKLLCKHNVCGHEYYVTPNAFLKGTRCPKCFGSTLRTNEEFQKEVYDLVGDEYLFLEEYINTNTKINCKHSKCNNEWSVAPNFFLNRGVRCPLCTIEMRAKKLKKTNSQFAREVRDLIGNEYIFLEKYVNNKTKIKCRHTTCGHEYYVQPSNFLSGRRCPQCASNMKKTTKSFKREVYVLVGKEYEVLEKYVDVTTKIKMKHNICGDIWRVTPNSFLTGVRCPSCTRIVATKKRTKTADFFKQEIYALVGNEYKFLEEYKKDGTKIKCKHNRCGYVWSVTPGSFLQGTRCPQCNESRGEQAIRMCLEDNHINFKQEYSFDSLFGVRHGLLRFDFAVFDTKDDLKLLIEYDGEFHFENIHNDERFTILQTHDNLKNQYCKDNSIPLLRIPYWEFDNIEKILYDVCQIDICVGKYC